MPPTTKTFWPQYVVASTLNEVATAGAGAGPPTWTATALLAGTVTVAVPEEPTVADQVVEVGGEAVAHVRGAVCRSARPTSSQFCTLAAPPA